MATVDGKGIRIYFRVVSGGKTLDLIFFFLPFRVAFLTRLCWRMRSRQESKKRAGKRE